MTAVFILGSGAGCHLPAQLGRGEKEEEMRRVTKAVLVAIALAGAATAVSAPAKAAAGVYFGSSGGAPSYGGYYSSAPYAGYSDPYSGGGYADPYSGGGYADPYYDSYSDPYADPYACDYYDPPWGYPPDYCLYQTWNEPVYSGGLWYSGPIYYRNYSGANWFWLNGGWRRDEWRGARPGGIDWGRNMRWSGQLRPPDFAGRGGDYKGGNRGAYNGGNWKGGQPGAHKCGQKHRGQPGAHKRG